MAMTILARNYRGLADVRWSIPPGLSVVVGANGAGKTTLLFVADLLRMAATQSSSGLGAAIDWYGGAHRLRYFWAAPEEPVVLGVEVDGSIWEIEPFPVGAAISEHAAERLTIDGERVFQRVAGAPTFEWHGRSVSPEGRTVIRRIADSDLEGTFAGRRLLEVLEAYRVHHDPNLYQLRRGYKDSNHTTLHRNGMNAFTVLRNWRDWSPDRHRFDFVIDSLRDCFGFFEGIDFQKSGDMIEGYIVHRGFRGESVHAREVANGLLLALLHFTAVASANRGQVVAIDEFENSLHPRAIRRALELIDDYAQTEGVSVVLTTHSAEVLDWFDRSPERVFILDNREKPSPRPLTDLRSVEWLSHFRLGQKYAEGDFGSEHGQP